MTDETKGQSMTHDENAKEGLFWQWHETKYGKICNPAFAIMRSDGFRAGFKAALSLQPQWRDIASAPKGSWIIVADSFGISAWQASWSEQDKCFTTESGSRLIDAKWWQPLPLPPTPDKEG